MAEHVKAQPSSHEEVIIRDLDEILNRQQEITFEINRLILHKYDPDERTSYYYATITSPINTYTIYLSWCDPYLFFYDGSGAYDTDEFVDLENIWEWMYRYECMQPNNGVNNPTPQSED